MKFIVVLIFIFINLFNLCSKTSNEVKVDSLIKRLRFLKNDTAKVNVLYDLSFMLQMLHPKNGIKYGFEGLNLSAKIKWDKGVAKSYLVVGINHLALSNFDSALYYYEKSILINQQLKDIRAVRENYEYIAALHSIQSKYPKLKNYLNKLIEINKKLGDSINLANEYNNLGLVNLYLSNYNEALRNFNKSYIINHKFNDSSGIGYNFINTGRVYYNLGEYDKAKNNYAKAYIIFKKLGNEYNLLRINNFVSEVWMKKNEPDSALISVEENLKNYNIFTDNETYGRQIELREWGASLITKGKILLKKNKFNEALIIGNESLEFFNKIKYEDGKAKSYSLLGKINNSKSKQNNSIRDFVFIKNNILQNLNNAENLFRKLNEKKERSDNLKLISEIYDELGQTDSSYFYYKLYVKLNESLFNEENAKAIGRLESEVQHKLDILKSENKVKSAREEIKVTQQKYQYLAIIFILLLIVLLFMLLIYIRKNSFTKQLEIKNNIIENQKVDLEVKNSSLGKLNNAKNKIFIVIGHDLRNGLKSFRSLALKLKEQNQQSSLNKEIDLLHNSTLDLTNLLESLMDYADIEFNQIEVDKVSLDLSKIIEENINLFKNLILQKNLKINNNFNFCVAKTNYHYASIVIRNIIHNSIKFSPENNDINIKVFSEDCFTIIIIEDNGKGISEEDIEKINNYIKPSSSNAENIIGNGFGLITAKELIEKVGGSLYIDSKIGIGTKIHIYFPQ